MSDRRTLVLILVSLALQCSSLNLPVFAVDASDSVAEAYASQASRSFDRGELVNAINLYQQAIEQEQKDANDELYIAKLHNDLGECYRHLALDKGQLKLFQQVNIH